MSVQTISYAQARALVLDRLRTKWATLSAFRRNLKLVYLNYSLSPNDIIREVQNNTEIGQQILAAELNDISREEGIIYQVQG